MLSLMGGLWVMSGSAPLAAQTSSSQCQLAPLVQRPTVAPGATGDGDHSRLSGYGGFGGGHGNAACRVRHLYPVDLGVAIADTSDGHVPEGQVQPVPSASVVLLRGHGFQHSW